MEENRSLASIPDDDLLRRLGELIGQSRRVEVEIVAHIAEVEGRKLFARKAFPSMFAYCREVLHLSEQEAYLRIAVARASREHPMLLTMLADGRLHLTAIGKLAPHLTRENRDGLLERAVHKTKREVEELIAEIAPRPDAPVAVRKLPEARPVPQVVPPKGGSDPMLAAPILDLSPDPTRQLGPDLVGATAGRGSVSPRSAFVVQPLSPGRYKVQFTASTDFRHKLERLQALMGSGGADRDLAVVIEQAVTEKLERLEARRFGRTRTPRNSPRETQTRDTPPPPPPPPSPPSGPIPGKTQLTFSLSSRYIPAAVRRAVYQRDGGRCRYVDEQGRRCQERDRLEFHHGHPFGLGGDHGVANVRLMCHAHNIFLAECDYGRAAIARHRRSGSRASPTPAG